MQFRSIYQSKIGDAVMLSSEKDPACPDLVFSAIVPRIFCKLIDRDTGFASWRCSKFPRSLLVDGDEFCGHGGVPFRSLRLDLKDDYIVVG